MSSELREAVALVTDVVDPALGMARYFSLALHIQHAYPTSWLRCNQMAQSTKVVLIC